MEPILQEVITHLKGIKDIYALAQVNKEFHKRVASRELLSYLYVKRYNSSLPNELTSYAGKKYPWRLEFFFLPEKFFFVRRGECYFSPNDAYLDALLRKDKWDAKFIESHCNLGVASKDKSSHIFQSLPGNLPLTREQVEFATTFYSNLSIYTEDYIKLLADYGDFDYYEQQFPERNSRVDSIFVKRMIAYGRDGLSEAYYRYPNNLVMALIVVKVAHPEQKKLPLGLDGSYLESCESKYTSAANAAEPHLPEVPFSSRKYARTKENPAYAPRDNKFVQWLIKVDPEVIPKWYSQEEMYIPNYYITKTKGNKLGHTNFYYGVIDTAFESGDSLEEIFRVIEPSDDSLEKILKRLLCNMDYPSVHRLLEWDQERILGLLQKPEIRSYGYATLLLEAYQ